MQCFLQHSHNIRFASHNLAQNHRRWMHLVPSSSLGGPMPSMFWFCLTLWDSTGCVVEICPCSSGTHSLHQEHWRCCEMQMCEENLTKTTIAGLKEGPVNCLKEHQEWKHILELQLRNCVNWVFTSVGFMTMEGVATVITMANVFLWWLVGALTVSTLEKVTKSKCKFPVDACMDWNFGKWGIGQQAWTNETHINEHDTLSKRVCTKVWTLIWNANTIFVT